MASLERMNNALNRLCKWRSVLAGWHLGTRAADAPGVEAMRDLMDFRLVLRAEVNALTTLLVEKKLVTLEQLHAAIASEADHLELIMQQSFPGYRATDTGMTINPAVAAETNRVKGFPD